MSDGSVSDYHIALAAAILAAAAFITSFLQALLQYLSSSESRSKCSRPAIGPWHKLVKWRWSLQDWKLKIYYPTLYLTSGKVLNEIIASRRESIHAVPFIDRIRQHRGDEFSWRNTERTDRVRWWHVADQLTVLVWAKKPLSEDMVSMSDLSWDEWLRFLWYRLRHPFRQLETPRASWAQILLSLGIGVAPRLKLRTVDADTVSTYLDTPTQRINFFQLGTIAFLMGFHSVEIDVPKRTFKALSPLGTITTEEVPSLGKVLRFEGDITAIHVLVSRCHPDWIFRAHLQANGKISFGLYVTNGLSCSLRLIRAAVLRNMPNTRFDRQETDIIKVWRRDFRAGPVFREATCLKTILRTLLKAEAGRAKDKDKPAALSDESAAGIWTPNQYKTEDEKFRDFANTDHNTKYSVFLLPHDLMHINGRSLLSSVCWKLVSPAGNR
jgi:hypothetical protein